MRSLRELQRAFADDLSANTATNTAQRIAVGRFPRKRRLQIYRNNYFLSLTKVLRDIHPTVRKLVGDDFFNYTATEFIKVSPPLTGNLHNYGEQFAVFLNEFDPSAKLPYLHDVARLDWAHHCAYHAADSVPVPLDRINAVPAESYADLMFVLSPSASILTSRHPVYSIWQFSQAETETDIAPTLDSGGEQVLVFRPALDIVTKRITMEEYVFISALDRGLTLSNAIDVAVKSDSAFELNSVLGQCLSSGLIVNLNLKKK